MFYAGGVEGDERSFLWSVKPAAGSAGQKAEYRVGAVRSLSRLTAAKTAPPVLNDSFR